LSTHLYEISSKAAGKTENKKKFQGQEFAHGEFSDGNKSKETMLIV
jgi:hypothetical protein